MLVNQIGSKRNDVKKAVVRRPGTYFVQNDQGETVLTVEALTGMQDPLCDEFLYVIDFSTVSEVGSYHIADQNGMVSYSFEINDEVYKPVHLGMLRALYYNRCGCQLLEKHAGIYHHGTCHNDKVLRWNDHQYRIECSGGWHDAGDYGRYITPGAVTIGHLLYAYKLYPEAFEESMNIPESGNGVADVLNECRYELEWMLKMQEKDGGVYHKLTSWNHVDFIMPEEDKDPFYLFEVSSLATADYCAIMALSYRIYKESDHLFANKLYEAANLAWNWLMQHEEALLFKNPESSNTGEYGDESDLDERLWASVEMYYMMDECNESTDEYKYKIEELLNQDLKLIDFGWTDVSGFSSMAILLDEEKKLGDKIYNICYEKVMQEAKRLLKLRKLNAFQIGMDVNDFEWGSNMIVTNRGILWCLAFKLTDDIIYKDAVKSHIDYLFGMNITEYSFITGFGENAYRYPHSRPCHADGIEEPIPGWVSGGPNGEPCDELAVKMIPKHTPPMKCYLDREECYSLNEMTIYWNSSALFLTAFLMTN